MKPSETRSGGVSHYTFESHIAPDQPDAITLSPPSETFRNFVRGLGLRPVSTAVELGQFQRQLEQTLKVQAERPGPDVSA
jgi:hypothetical protein